MSKIHTIVNTPNSTQTDLMAIPGRPMFVRAKTRLPDDNTTNSMSIHSGKE